MTMDNHCLDSYISFMATKNPDVIVIGGGPAGSTVSTLIAQKGYRVELFEREHFPRFHIGESLIPQTYWVLKRLNMLPKMKGSHFVKKYSVQFINAHGKLSEPFYFVNHRPHESSQTWQVKRSEFDHLMLDNAREHGVDVHEGVRVLQVLFEGQRAVGVRLVDEDGKEKDVIAKVVVDAGGQSSMILDRLKLRQWDGVLRKGALWTYWKGAQRDTGRDEGATLVIQTKGKHGWFWYIPLHDDILSVGVVAAYDYLFKNRPGKDLETIYFEEVAACPGVQPRIANAQRIEPFRAAKEYSYRSTKAAGDGWALVGDAFGFLDPLYSSGVLLALKSGEMAADAITEGLAKGDTSAAQLGNWQTDFCRGMDRMRRLICEFYDGFSFGRFIKKHPHLKGFVTDVLIGDLFKDDVDVLWPLIDEMRADQQPAITESPAASASGG
jgi:flavin-dependent dehydrogenase